MIRDEPADQALRLVELYKQAAERTPQGHVPTMAELSNRRAAIVRLAHELGVWPLFQVGRDGFKTSEVA